MPTLNTDKSVQTPLFNNWKQIIPYAFILFLSLTALLFTFLYIILGDFLFEVFALGSSVILALIGIYTVLLRGSKVESDLGSQNLFSLQNSEDWSSIEKLETGVISKTIDSVERANQVLASLPASILLYDIQSDRIIYSNEVLQFFLEQDIDPKENFLQSFYRQIVLREDFNKVLRHFEFLRSVPAALAKPFHELDYRIRTSSGVIRYLRNRDRIFMRDSLGKPLVILCVIRDVSEYVLAYETALYNSTILENVDEAIVATDISFIIRGWNKSAEKIFELSAEQAIGKTLSEALRIQLTAEVSSKIINSLSTNGNWKGILEQRKIDGTELVIMLNLSALKNDEGETIGTIGIINDITTERMLELREQEANERYALAVEGSNDGIWDWDLQNDKVYYSSRWKQMIGYADHELGNTFSVWESLIHPEDKKRVVKALNSYIRRETNQYQVEFRFRHKDGSYRWVYSRGVGVWDANGNVYRIAGSHTDITERKEFELQLESAKQAAELASKAKSEFIATISHELRTPLNGVIGMTSLLTQTPLSNEQKQYLENIQFSGQSLLSLINDILDFSQLEASIVKLEPQPFNVEESIISSIEQHSLKASVKSLDISYSIDPTIPPILIGDGIRIRQVLSNIVSNAVKFTETGEVHIRVRPLEASHEQITLEFEVHDTGIGISNPLAEKLFKPFSQLEGAFNRRYSGMGLGLALSSQLIELMKGKISVSSEVGKGSIFTFSVPLQIQSAQSQNTQEKARYFDAFGLQLKIYWVDERPMALQASNQFLLNEGLSVIPNISLSEVILTTQKGNHPDVIILSLSDKPISAEEIAYLHQARETGTRLGVLCFQQSFDAVSKMNIFDFVLVKPVRHSKTLLALQKVLSSANAARPIAIEGTYPYKKHDISILVAEDYAINQRVILGILKKLGYDADVATNGIEALHLFDQRYYDIVFMDIQMPEMDGLQATREILKRFPSEKVPVILAMTANSTQTDRDNCFQAGMKDFLAKPITIDTVSAMIEYWAAVIQSGRSPSPAHHHSIFEISVEENILNLSTIEMLQSLPSVGNGTLLNELIDLFIQQVPQQIQKVKLLYSESNAPLLRKAAHALKGTSLNIGAAKLGDFAHKIEVNAQHENLSECELLIHALEPAYESSLQKLLQIKQSN
ncbi:MAG: PAS domain S-box protein [Chloroherpetonaceae bacterium]|nr:PAS domain S-box protein [Chloroherpetonaceae bacterium]